MPAASDFPLLVSYSEKNGKNSKKIVTVHGLIKDGKDMLPTSYELTEGTILVIKNLTEGMKKELEQMLADG